MTWILKRSNSEGQVGEPVGVSLSFKVMRENATSRYLQYLVATALDGDLSLAMVTSPGYPFTPSFSSEGFTFSMRVLDLSNSQSQGYENLGVETWDLTVTAVPATIEDI